MARVLVRAMDDVDGKLTTTNYHEWQQGRDAPGKSTVAKRFGKWSTAVEEAERLRENDDDR